MKSGFSLILALSAWMMIGCANMRTAVHSSWPAQNEPRLAVFPLSGDEPYNEELADALVTEFLGVGFSVMERTQVQQILKEHRLQNTGFVDPKTMTETGRLAGVDFIVIGTVSSRRYTPLSEMIFGNGFSREQVDIVRLRWINVRSGQIMAATAFRNGRGGSLESVARRIAQSFDRRVEDINRFREPSHARNRHPSVAVASNWSSRH